MKSRILINTIFFSVSLFLIACNSNDHSKILPHTNNVIVSDTCKLHDIREDQGKIIPEMTAICAEAMINKYEEKTQNIKSDYPLNRDIDSLLIRGVAIHRHEMRRILHIVEKDSLLYSDSIYIMLAVHNSGYAGMIFTVEKTVPAPGYNRYFNFTRPCPDACPDIPALIF